MTKAQDSPVTRETNAQERGRPIIATLKGSVIELRIKGLRSVEILDYEVALACARKVAAREAGVRI